MRTSAPHHQHQAAEEVEADGLAVPLPPRPRSPGASSLAMPCITMNTKRLR